MTVHSDLTAQIALYPFGRPYPFVLCRVEESVAEHPGVQQIEVAEQELIEGKLCP
jgi:hypothetical protein